MNIPKIALLATVCALSVSVCGWAAPPCDGFSYIYCQPFDQTGNAYSSQNDTASLGNFATTYDNFALASNSAIDEVTWQGGFFDPPLSGSPSPSGFALAIYADSGGKPGQVLDTVSVSAAESNPVLIGPEVSGVPGGAGLIYDYSANVGPISLQAGSYWLSIVADLQLLSAPPFTVGEWGWHTGKGGDGLAYQTDMGTTSAINADMAFTLIGTASAAAPEPSALLMAATAALAGLGAWARKRRRP